MRKFFKLIFILSISFSFAQNAVNSDSLNKTLAAFKADTNKIKQMHAVCDHYLNIDPSVSLKYCLENIELSNKLKYRLYWAYYDLAYCYFVLGEYKKSIENFQNAQKHTKGLNSPSKEDYLGRINEGLASVYLEMKNFKNAIDAQQIAIKYYEQNKDPFGVAIAQMNLARMYIPKNELNKARDLYLTVEKYFLSQSDSTYLLNVYTGLGNIYSSSNDNATALRYFEKASVLTERFAQDDYARKAIILINKSTCHLKLKNTELALKEARAALEINKSSGSPDLLEANYKQLAEVYSEMGDSKSSIDYYNKYIQLKDSLFNEENSKIIHEMSVKYESEKKEQENLLLSKDNEKKQLGIYFSIGGLILLVGLVFMIYRNSRQKTKANNLLSAQKHIIEEQNKDITDSIKYAQRIQGAILPPDQMWNSIFPKSFVLYKPKDILSGDFYWVEETDDWRFAAAADCTGHGVPGALMSIVNFNLLNKAVLEKKLCMPGEILDSVNELLTGALHQTFQESAVKDGMDITLLAVNKKTGEVYFAGANNPIYILGKDKDEEIRGDKFPVGAFVDETIKHFTTHKLNLAKGDQIFLFSDGYADQFGGSKGKKFMYKQMKEKMKTVLDLSYDQQKSSLNNTYDAWKGGLEQVDDVLVIGIRV